MGSFPGRIAWSIGFKNSAGINLLWTAPYNSFHTEVLVLAVEDYKGTIVTGSPTSQVGSFILMLVFSNQIHHYKSGKEVVY